jgi:competence protein ComGC
VIGLLVVALIVALAYKFYFSKMQTQETRTPMQTINVVGVKNDLLAIAQAERAFQAEHGTYASLEDLRSSGAMTMTKAGRDGYTYEVESSSAGFRVVAHCPAAASPECSNWAVDQSMEVMPAR